MKNLIILVLAGLVLSTTSCLKEVQSEEDHSFKLTFDTIRITQGITHYLAAKDLSAAEITWKSADTTIAKIDNRGVVNGIKAGQTLITATSIKYKTTANCVVIVLNNKITNIKVSDVGAGADGSVFTIGTDVVSPTGGFGIYRLQGDSLAKLPYCAGTRVAVAPNGKPWVVNKSLLIYRYRDDQSPWDEIPGSANDIAIGPDGSVYIVSTQAVAGGGFRVMKWNALTYSWDMLPSIGAMRIAVDATGLPWVVNFTNQVLKYDGTSWKPAGVALANDIGIGKDGSVFITGIDAKASIYKFNKQTNVWSTQEGLSGTSISVLPTGMPVYIDASGFLHK